VLSYLSEISKSRILKSDNLSVHIFSDHFLFVIIVAPETKLGNAFSRLSQLKAKTISTFLVKKSELSLLILTSK
jgi:hypothetical protein